MNQSLKIVILSSLTFAVLFVIVANFVPLTALNIRGPQLGTVATTDVQSTDLLTAWPALYNANLALLNNGKVDIASTTWPQLTTAAGLTTAGALATVGTITSGTWNGDAIGVAYNGTGTTSPTSNQVMIGNGSSGFKVIGFGTSGQFLTSQGDATAPQWTTSSIDEGIDYNFTGSAFRVKNLHASSTSANPLVLNGLSLNTPDTLPNFSSIFKIDSSGNISFETQSNYDGFADIETGTTTVKIPWGVLNDASVSGSVNQILSSTGAPLSGATTSPFITISSGGSAGNTGRLTMDADLTEFTNNFDFLGSVKFLAKFSATSSIDAFMLMGEFGVSGNKKAFGVFVQNNTFYCLADSGSASSTSAFGTGFDATVWNTYEIVKNSATSVECRVNGVSQATVSSNVPTGALDGVEFDFGLFNRGSSANMYAMDGYTLKIHTQGF